MRLALAAKREKPELDMAVSYATTQVIKSSVNDL